MRSIWKGHFFKLTDTLHKSSTIFNTMLKKKFFLHDGKVKKIIFISRPHIGSKAGEFIFTRKVGVVHKKKKSKKKK